MELRRRQSTRLRSSVLPAVSFRTRSCGASSIPSSSPSSGRCKRPESNAWESSSMLTDHEAEALHIRLARFHEERAKLYPIDKEHHLAVARMLRDEAKKLKHVVVQHQGS